MFVVIFSLKPVLRSILTLALAVFIPEDTVAIDSSFRNNNNVIMISSMPFFGSV